MLSVSQAAVGRRESRSQVPVIRSGNQVKADRDPPKGSHPGLSVMVFESLVSDLLNRFIGDYVENLDKSQLKIGIWGGEPSS